MIELRFSQNTPELTPFLLQEPGAIRLNLLALDILAQESRHDGGTKYDHALRVEEFLKSIIPKEVTPELLLAVRIHDLVDMPHDENVSVDTRSSILRTIQRAYAESPIAVTKALAYANSAEMYKQAAETWRGEVTNNLEELKRVEPAEMNDKIISAINDRNGTVELDRDILSYRPPMADIEKMLESCNYDIEGLQLAAAELWDKVIHPNDKKPTATWRDALDLLYFFGPLLEAAGYKEFAMMSYDIALSFLHKNTYSPEEEQRFERMYKDGGGWYKAIAQDIVSDLHDISGGEVYTRPKSKGSSKEKQQEKGHVIGILPDQYGFKIVVDDEFEPDQIRTLVAEVFDVMITKYGLIPGHTKDSEPAIEITMDGFGVDSKAEVAETLTLLHPDLEIMIKVEGRRLSGYAAAHLSFRLSLSGSQDEFCGVEVQIVRRSDQIQNDTGIASHFIYKTGNRSMGEFPKLKRQAEIERKKHINGEPSNTDIVVNYFTKRNEYVAMIKKIRTRAQNHSEESRNGKHSVTPTSINKIIELFGLPISEEVRGAVAAEL